MSKGANVVAFRVRIKRALVVAFGNKCYCCGQSYPECVYDFHHINPEEKEFGIACGGSTKAKEKIAHEAKKCIMVCSNCHRLIEHTNLIQQPMINNFNESLFYETISKEIEEQKKIQKKRRSKIKKNNITNKKEGVVRHNVVYPTREQLKDMIRHMSFIEIGEIYGFTDNAIRKWCRKMDLPDKKRDIKEYSDKEWKQI